MSHSEKCPVCLGTGRLPNDGKTSDATDNVCHGCHGLGWITVYDNIFPDYPIKPSIDIPDYNDPCAGCSNNPKNNPNASGFCGCTLPYLRRSNY